MRAIHHNIVRHALTVIAATLFFPASVHAAPAPVLPWSQMLPPGEAASHEVIFWAMERLMDPKSKLSPERQNAEFQKLKSQLRYDAMPALHNRRVRLAGFLVPLDAFGGGNTREFLVVPYFGACLHLPAPNPNQIVHVRTAQPQAVPDIRQAYWVQGILKVERHESAIASTTYKLVLDGIEPYRGKANPYAGPVPHANGN